MNEQSEIRNLKGIGAKTEELFHKMGIFTIGDLLRYYPRGYDVYEEPVSVGELEEGKISTVKGVIYGKSTGWRRKAYADYDSIRKRSDWYFEGDLVSYAVSA